jgi:hypothetical protein
MIRGQQILHVANDRNARASAARFSFLAARY